MSLFAWVVAFAATFVFGTGVGMRWEKGQEAIRQQEAQKVAHENWVKQEKKVDTAAVSFEKKKEQVRTEFLVITERIEDAKQTEFYAAGAPACFDDAGVRIVNDAARPAASAASQPASGLPRSPATRKWWPFSRAGQDGAVGADVQGVPVKAPRDGAGVADTNQRLSSISSQQRVLSLRGVMTVSVAIQPPAAHVGGT